MKWARFQILTISTGLLSIWLIAKNCPSGLKLNDRMPALQNNSARKFVIKWTQKTAVQSEMFIILFPTSFGRVADRAISCLRRSDSDNDRRRRLLKKSTAGSTASTRLTTPSTDYTKVLINFKPKLAHLKFEREIQRKSPSSLNVTT